VVRTREALLKEALLDSASDTLLVTSPSGIFLFLLLRLLLGKPTVKDSVASSADSTRLQGLVEGVVGQMWWEHRAVESKCLAVKSVPSFL